MCNRYSSFTTPLSGIPASNATCKRITLNLTRLYLIIITLNQLVVDNLHQKMMSSHQNDLLWENMELVYRLH